MKKKLTALLVALPALPTLAATGAATATYPTWDGKQETVHYATPDAGAALRSYTQSTTMRVREGGKQEVSYAESPALPTVRSGNLAFDALFALAGNEMKLDSVSEIRDGSYNGGNAIPASALKRASCGTTCGPATCPTPPRWDSACWTRSARAIRWNSSWPAIATASRPACMPSATATRSCRTPAAAAAGRSARTASAGPSARTKH
jgi:hypothetical protein